LALKGLVVNLQKPLEFQFIVDTGDSLPKQEQLKQQANQLVNISGRPNHPEGIYGSI